jgi:hypothetical protein
MLGQLWVCSNRADRVGLLASIIGTLGGWQPFARRSCSPTEFGRRSSEAVTPIRLRCTSQGSPMRVSSVVRVGVSRGGAVLAHNSTVETR